MRSGYNGNSASSALSSRDWLYPSSGLEEAVIEEVSGWFRACRVRRRKKLQKVCHTLLNCVVA